MGSELKLRDYQLHFIEDQSDNIIVASGRRTGKDFMMIQKILKSPKASKTIILTPYAAYVNLIADSFLRQHKYAKVMHSKGGSTTLELSKGRLVRIICQESELRGMCADAIYLMEFAYSSEQVKILKIIEAIKAHNPKLKVIILTTPSGRIPKREEEMMISNNDNRYELDTFYIHPGSLTVSVVELSSEPILCWIKGNTVSIDSSIPQGITLRINYQPLLPVHWIWEYDTTKEWSRHHVPSTKILSTKELKEISSLLSIEAVMTEIYAKFPTVL